MARERPATSSQTRPLAPTAACCARSPWTDERAAGLRRGLGGRFAAKHAAPTGTPPRPRARQREHC
eukprot:15472933-Alexandrium_andersonii.AAC.1